MDKEDARKQSAEALFERRKQVIRLLHKGEGVMRIVELTGLSYPTVRSTIDRFEAGGLASLKPKSRGKKQGDGRKLTPDQEAELRKMICDKRPEQLKMDFALWTRAAVMELIDRECGLKLRVRAVGNYLKRRGFTPQKPIKRAYEQCPQAVKQWLDEKYPAIEQRARAEGGEVHWGDETAIVNTDMRGRGYAPKGQTPIAFAPGTRQKMSTISTATKQGKARLVERNCCSKTSSKLKQRRNSPKLTG